MKLLLFTLCLCLFSARFDETSGTQGNRIANELVQKPFIGLNPKIVKEVRITFIYESYAETKYRTVHVTKRQEIVALVHAFRKSSREKHGAREPIGVLESGDTFEFYLKGSKDEISFDVYPDPMIKSLWGPEVARLHRHYRNLAAHVKPTDSWPD